MRIVTMSMLVSAVLLVGGICFSQDKQADAAGAKAGSPWIRGGIPEEVGGPVGDDDHHAHLKSPEI